MDLSGNDKNKITGKKYQPVMSVTGLNDQGPRLKSWLQTFFFQEQLAILTVKLKLSLIVEEMEDL